MPQLRTKTPEDHEFGVIPTVVVAPSEADHHHHHSMSLPALPGAGRAVWLDFEDFPLFTTLTETDHTSPERLNQSLLLVPQLCRDHTLQCNV
jgi:hypothetical protein